MGIKIPECRDCPDRVLPANEHNGCRSWCKRWKEYEKLKKAADAERRRRVNEKADIDSFFSGTELNQRVRRERNRRNQMRRRDR